MPGDFVRDLSRVLKARYFHSLQMRGFQRDLWWQSLEVLLVMDLCLYLEHLPWLAHLRGLVASVEVHLTLKAKDVLLKWENTSIAFFENIKPQRVLPSRGAFGRSTSRGLGLFFLGLVFSFDSCDPGRLLGESSTPGPSNPKAHPSSGSSTSGAIGRYKSPSLSSSSASESQKAGILASVTTSTSC